MRAVRSSLAILILGLAATSAAGQPTPEDVARSYLDALGRLRWEGVADHLHSAVLDDFRLVAVQLVDSRRGDSILSRLYGVGRPEFDAWTPRESFHRSMEGLVRYARGLMESQVTTEVRILGTVPEGDTIHHVVYREATDHMGTVTEGVRTVSLVLEGGRWRVRDNGELHVLETALRGVPIGRSPPGPDPSPPRFLGSSLGRTL